MAGYFGSALRKAKGKEMGLGRSITASIRTEVDELTDMASNPYNAGYLSW